MSSTAPLLEVRDLSVAFSQVKAVNGISFEIQPGEVCAIVGESGSGKSVTALALAGLLPRPPECRTAGSIKFNDRQIEDLSKRELNKLRGKEIAYIFQEPSACLNPVFTIGSQLVEAIRIHRKDVEDRKDFAIRLLERVGIREAPMRFHAYPAELSGGMLQRVMIAIGILGNPRLLVADEPTTALDVTIERQIIELLGDLHRESNTAILMITHNFGIIKGFADRILVMRHGEIVEQGETAQVMSQPNHPYTRGLIDCIPRLGTRRDRLPLIK